jgi:hypothetical protein
MRFKSILSVCAFAVSGAAQLPAQPEGITILQSQVEDGARISYKEASSQHPPSSQLPTDLHRTTCAKQLKASEATLATSISQPELSRT